MIKNFLTVAVRSFLRQRFFSIINLLGLASGLTCTLLIYLWVKDELSVDRFHEDANKIYRVISNLKQRDGSILTWPITPGPQADDIRENIPEVEWVARTQDQGDQLFQYEDKSYLEPGFYADPAFFQIFSFRLVDGSAPGIGFEKNWVAISQQLARKLFGDTKAVGKTIQVARKYDLTVTTVFDDIGNESSIDFEYVMPFEIYREIRGDGFNWGNFDHPLYIKLHDASQDQVVIDKINERLALFIDPAERDFGYFTIQPFVDKYLYSGFENGLPVTGRIKYVKVFSVVAIFILVIACINFMNLATARAVMRAKEVGVRKVVGAERKNLIVQFLSESIFISAISMTVALAFVILLLPLFNLLTSKNIELGLGDPFLVASILMIVVLTGLLAGTYPAFFLSSYRPMSVLKGTVFQHLTGNSLREFLVVFQFSLTVILIVSALVVFDQISYIRNKNLGYQRNNVISFVARGDITNQFEAFRNEVLQQPGVKSISRTNQSLVQVDNQTNSVSWSGKDQNAVQYFRIVIVDFEFLETMQLTLQEGRFFSKDFNDEGNFVLTQKSVETMGLMNPIGEKIFAWENEGMVVGVVNDIHSRTLHEAIDPIVFYCKPERTRLVNVRIETSEVEQVLKGIEATFKKFSPEYPFDFTFLDDNFEKQYNNEKVAGALAITFTVMAIIISGLGLIGLAAYTAERRKKEIGIRKTMGATVTTIITLIFKDFIRLCVIAIAIGCPLAYYLMNLFLEGFAYHTSIDAVLFIYTASIMLVFTMAVVIFQVTRAAMANPVDTLRNE